MDHPESVLLVSFRQTEYEAFVSQGVTVGAYIRVIDRGDPAKSYPVEMHEHYPVVRCEIDTPLRTDMPTDLRRRLHAKAFTPFRRHYSRIAFARNNALRSWTHLDNLFYIAAAFYFDLLTRKNITSTIFSNFPHEGSLVVLYHLCQLMGVGTVLTTQSQFPGKLWITRRIEDFGPFHTVSGGGEALPAPAEPTTPFYMKRRGKTRRQVEMGARVVSETLKYAAKVVTLQTAFNKNAVDRNLNRLVQARDRFSLGNPSPGDVTDADLDAPFIYFPLHLQPEMTTDTWGLDYGDQLLAIEELAATMPPGFGLYLKENPIQTRYMREESFFRRLRAIPGVRYVSPNLPTFDLIRRSACVATITGTVGWEAALMGKGVVHFGVTWYSSLPGVWAWTGRPSLDAALAWRGDRDALVQGFDALSRKLYPGVIDKAYGKLIPGYDRDAWAARAVASLISVLRETDAA